MPQTDSSRYTGLGKAVNFSSKMQSRQGCSLSLISFNTVLEVLARTIRRKKQRASKPEQRGITVSLRIAWSYIQKVPNTLLENFKK